MSSNRYIPISDNTITTTGTIRSVSATDCSAKKYNMYLPAEFKEGLNTPSDRTTIDGIPLTEYIEHIVDIRLRAILKEMKGTL